METKVCSVVFVLFVFVLGCCQSSKYVFRFANVLGDHMVLQQAPHRAQLWGYGEVGRIVKVTMKGKDYHSVTAPNGTWSVFLEPTTFGGPHIINAYSVVNGKFVKASLKDVLFGDVWICSGQSNMAFTLASSKGGYRAIRRSAGYPNIRLFTAAIGTSDVPLSELKYVRKPWSVASPGAVGAFLPFTYFSAVCWYYGVQLYDKLQYPIGLVSTAYPGTPIEAWSSPDALAKCELNDDHNANFANVGSDAHCKPRDPGKCNKLTHRFRVGAVNIIGQSKGSCPTAYPGTPIKAWSSPDAHAKCELNDDHQCGLFDWLKSKDPRNPSVLWYGMVTPFLRMTIYGVIWYQGEENADRPNLNYPYYCAFPAMIDDWRAKWYQSTDHNTNETFPFGFVQLSAVGHSTTSQRHNFAQLRWDQTAHFGYAPNTREKYVFMAVAKDLGEPWAPLTSYHPRYKEDVGQRLARAGLAIAYGVNVYYTGPLLSKIKQQDSSVKVIFKSVFHKIEVRSTSGFEVLCKHTIDWIKAPITGGGPTFVIIKTPAGCIVQGVRYAWSDYPCVFKKCAIYSDDLPSPPFIKYGPF